MCWLAAFSESICVVGIGKVTGSWCWWELVRQLAVGAGGISVTHHGIHGVGWPRYHQHQGPVFSVAAAFAVVATFVPIIYSWVHVQCTF